MVIEWVLWNILLLAIISPFSLFFRARARGIEPTSRAIKHFSARMFSQNAKKTARTRKKNLNNSNSIVICYRDCHTQLPKCRRFHSHARSYLTHPKRHFYTPSYRSHYVRLFAFSRSPYHVHLFTSWAKNLIIWPPQLLHIAEERAQCENHRIQSDARLNEIKLHAVNHPIIAFRHWWWR